MRIAEKSFDGFLHDNADIIFQICKREGFKFEVRESSRCITVRCELPSGVVRFVIFDDHRIENPHGGKPHVCNQWHKAVGDPISFTMGNTIANHELIYKVLLATGVMCITQSEAYNEMKTQIFL